MNVKSISPARTILAAAAVLWIAGAALGDVYQDIIQYDWGQSRLPLTAIEAQIREAKTPEARRAVEAKLLRALADPNATYACKQFVCRALRGVGSPASLPALTKLLYDPRLSHMARYALQRRPGADVDKALRDAMGKLTGKLRIGMISTIGQRRDSKAVPALAKLVAGGDTELARAAIRALGRIGCPGAAEALAAATVPAALKAELADACLLCADRLLADGQATAAAAVYRKMFAPLNPKPIRIAALRGLVLSEKEKAAGILVALMRDKDVDLRRAAAKFVVEMPGKAATEAFAAKLASMPAAGQTMLLDALTARADKAAAPAVTRLIKSRNESVRIAAIRALAVLGDASSVPVLAKAASGGGAVGQAATDSLNRLKGEGVGEAMARLLDSPDPAIRAGIIGVLAVRADKTMAPAMVKAARDKDENIRKAAIKGLAAAGGEKELPDIVALLLASKGEDERADLERALSASAGRVTDADARTAAIIAGLARADADAKARLVTILGRLGGAKALAAVRAQLQADDAEVAAAAVRALHSWPDAAPADDLLKIIKTTKDPTHKALAFRGYIRMANMAGVRSTAETTKMYEQALALATTVAEKKAVLGGLANARSADALKLVEALLAEAALRAEAEVALVQIADNARDAAPAEARAALKKIAASTKNAAIRQKAQAVLSDMDKYRGYIRSWLGSGPYTKGALFETAYPPEKDPKAAKWKVLTKGIGPQVIDLEQAIARGGNRAAYMKTHVWSPADRDVRLEIGSDDGVKIWINGKLVHSNNASRPCRPGEDKARAKLKEGWNPVLVKITQGGGEWAFCIRICNADGSALEGMKVSVEGK